MSGRNSWPPPGREKTDPEEQKKLIDSRLRTMSVDAILFRNEVFGLKSTPEEAKAQFERHFLESGMTFAEACEVLSIMVKNNFRLKLKHESKEK